MPPTVSTEPSVASSRPRRLVVCLDGTWNNTYMLKKRTDGHAVYKPTNVLKLARAVLPYDPDTQREQIVSYDVGVGALAAYPGTSNRVLAQVDKALGGVWGAGFEANIDQALAFLVLNHRPGDEVFIFGFSRGAATAQALTRFIDWAGGLPVKPDAYYLSRLFQEYLLHQGQEPLTEVLARINAQRAAEPRPLTALNPFQPVDVVLLGVWDTVIALGSTLSDRRAQAFRFHVGPEVPRCVRHARHALAIDEARSDFHPEIWQRFDPTTQTLEQLWFAGVHSNVGGGYVDDGLANVALRWMIEEASAHGLVFDTEFLKKYRPYAQDRLYRSESAMYRAADAVRRRSRGRRSLVRDPPSAHTSLHHSAITRMNADPAQRTRTGKLAHPDLRELYRPRNVIRLLAVQPDALSYLASIGINSPELPADVQHRIETERAKIITGERRSRFARTRLSGLLPRWLTRKGHRPD
jgi:uncharacterized protein (DUF2235 family)